MSVGDAIDPIELTTIDGTRIALPAPDRVTHLQFRRFAGCPVCDLHLRTFVRRRAEIEQAGVREIVLFHSSAVELRVHARDLPFPIVADPDRRLYVRFGVEAGRRALTDPRVWPYILKGVARALYRVIAGRQAMPPLVPEGGSFGLPADVLIGTDGIVLACKYGEHAYDQWSVEDLLELTADIGA
jgi:peroxiredoxin